MNRKLVVSAFVGSGIGLMALALLMQMLLGGAEPGQAFGLFIGVSGACVFVGLAAILPWQKRVDTLLWRIVIWQHYRGKAKANRIQQAKAAPPQPDHLPEFEPVASRFKLLHRGEKQ